MDRHAAVQILDLKMKAFEQQNFVFEVEGDQLVVATSRGHIPVTKPAIGTVASLFGIPSPYATKCPPHLQSLNFNFWVQQQDKQLRLLLNDEETEIIGFTRAGAPFFSDILSLLEAAEDAIGTLDNVEITRAYASPSHVSFSIVGPELYAPVVGDSFRSGVSVDFSPLDKESLTVAAFNYRLTCSNGAYATDIIQRMSRRHLPEDVSGWVHETVKQVWIDSPQQFPAIAHMAEIEIPRAGRADFIAHLYKDVGMPLMAREPLNDRLLTESTDTLYDFYNHVTNVATHHADMLVDPHLQRRLMMTAGTIVGHPELCRSCHRVL